jgi:type II secretory pathway pseudopilin PulG
MKKRGLSNIVLVVIIIGIALVSVVIVWNVISVQIDYNKEKISYAKNCMELSRLDLGSSCFDNISKEIIFIVKSIPQNDKYSKKILVVVDFEDNLGKISTAQWEFGENCCYDIKEDNKNYGEILEIPVNLETKKYVIDFFYSDIYNLNPKTLTIVSVLDNNEKCPVSEKVNLKSC